MQLTLSLDEETASQARALAERRQTSIEDLFSDFVRRAAQSEAMAGFLRVAREQCGGSDPGWRFDREGTHRRGAGG